jgi:cation/acetate symporter
MAHMPATRLGHPRVGLYLGIYTSLVVAIVLVAVLLEQLGWSDRLIGALLFGGPIILFATFGLALTTREPHDFFTAGRRVPAVIAGATTALTALGGVGLVSLTGALFLMGSDAFAILLGIPGGLVVMAVLLVPYLRKFGAYTVPSYLGTRLDSTAVRIVAAAVFAVPVLLMLVAEARLGGALAARLTGLPAAIMVPCLVGLVLLMVIGGGVRALTWSSAAKLVGVLIALVIPVTIAAVLISNVPLPQLTAGNVARNILRIEVQRSVPLLQAAPWMVDLPTIELEALGRRFLQMFGSIGGSAFSVVILVILAGVAGMPTLLARPNTTRSVLASRTAMAWSVILVAFFTLTMAAIAIYLRAAVAEQVFAQPADRLPGWFQTLVQQGIAAIDAKGSVQVTLAAIAFSRDGVLTALPVALGLPVAFVGIAIAGALAACLAAAAAHLVSLATSISDDIVLGAQADTTAASTHLTVVRVALIVLALAASGLALIPADPLQLFVWALTLSASACFPILVLSVLWKRLTAIGAIAGLLVGFTAAVSLILSQQLGYFEIHAPLPGAIAAPLAFLASITVSFATAAPSRAALELLRDMRVPGGETLMDRQRRLHRLKHGEQR